MKAAVVPSNKIHLIIMAEFSTVVWCPAIVVPQLRVCVLTQQHLHQIHMPSTAGLKTYSYKSKLVLL